MRIVLADWKAVSHIVERSAMRLVRGLTMVAIPASIERAIIISICDIMWLHCQVRRTHDTLSQVVDTVEVMAMVVARELVNRSAGQACVDARHHELQLM
jgi:hypothetical protein